LLPGYVIYILPLVNYILHNATLILHSRLLLYSNTLPERHVIPDLGRGLARFGIVPGGIPVHLAIDLEMEIIHLLMSTDEVADDLHGRIPGQAELSDDGEMVVVELVEHRLAPCPFDLVMKDFRLAWRPPVIPDSLEDQERRRVGPDMIQW